MKEMFFVVLLAILFLCFVFWRNHRNGVLQRRAKIAAAWGRIQDREYEYEEFARISHYFQRKQGDEFALDEITWDDLNMDEIFMQLNHTWSSAGEEMLYRLLRTPVFDEDLLAKRREKIRYFQEHRAEALQIQEVFHEAGRARRIALADYLYSLPKAPSHPVIRSIVQDLLLLLGIVLAVCNQQVGVLLSIVMIVVNILTYYQNKARIENYFLCITYLLRLLQAGGEIIKLNCDGIAKEKETLKQVRQSFQGIHRKAFWIASGINMSGSLLDMLLEYVRMITHVDLIAFESIRRRICDRIREMDILIETLGELESMIAIASYRDSLDYYCEPTWSSAQERTPSLTVKALYHPLIVDPVSNDLACNKGILITGSNASGKSTFLKSVAIAAILAQTIDTVPASFYKGDRFRILTSMSLKDNLKTQESYYMVEIRALKRILDEANAPGVPVLCCVDEVLRGTNTTERIAASAKLLESLTEGRVLPLAATHDLELTVLLKNCYANYHFAEEWNDGDVAFSYKLKEGPARTRNAIRLLSVFGYDPALVAGAEALVAHFEEKGTWEA